MILNMSCFNMLTVLFVMLLVFDFSQSDNLTTVAFSALKRANGNGYWRVIFEDVKLNEGSGYNRNNGKFTAPSDGLYVFSWSIITHEKKAIGTELVINDLAFGKAFSDARDATKWMDDSASNTIPVRMRRGQIAFIRVIGDWDNFIDGSGWSSFSGWRIGN